MSLKFILVINILTFHLSIFLPYCDAALVGRLQKRNYNQNVGRIITFVGCIIAAVATIVLALVFIKMFFSDCKRVIRQEKEKRKVEEAMQEGGFMEADEGIESGNQSKGTPHGE